MACSESIWRTHGFLPRNEQRVSFSGVQGHQLHRPGRVNVELEIKAGVIEGVWIIGQAVSIFETEIESSPTRCDSSKRRINSMRGAWRPG